MPEPTEQEQTPTAEQSTSVDVLSLPSVEMTQADYDYLSDAIGGTEEHPHASPDEIQTFLTNNNIEPGQNLIVAVVDGQPRVIAARVEDFGTRDRGLTEQLQAMVDASGQEIADAFAVENGEQSADTSEDPTQIDGDAKSAAEMSALIKQHRARQIEEAEQAAENLAVSISDQAPRVETTEDLKIDAVSERPADSRQEKYNRLKQQIADLVSRLSDLDQYYLEEYTKAGPTRYNEQQSFILKMSKELRADTDLIHQYEELYIEKENVRKG